MSTIYDHPYRQETNAYSPQASVVQIEASKLAPLIIVLAILTGLSIGIAAYSIIYAKGADTETRMLEYYVMELDGKLMSSGVIDPNRSWAAQKRNKEK